MIINFSRISNVEDPVERIRKETSSNGAAKKLGFFRESIAAIGHSFAADTSREKMAEPQKQGNTSFNVEKVANPPKKGHRSKGIFDTLFYPLEVRTEDKNPPSTFIDERGRMPLGGELQELKKPKETNDIHQNEDDFFGKHLESQDAPSHRGTVVHKDSSSLGVANITNLDI